MRAATIPLQRPANAKLLHVDDAGVMRILPRSRWIDALRPGDLVIANDAATLPASLRGIHTRTGRNIEVRLAGRRREHFLAIVFGEGDYRTRTEDRPQPPACVPGDLLQLGPLRARVEAVLDHPRLLELRMLATSAAMWSGIAKHGRPIQYAHLSSDLQLWDVWTPIAGPPVAYEPPSAGFVLDWRSLIELRRRHISFATLTHAAGISSTGDPLLDARLPFDEPYSISSSTAAAVNRALDRSQRIVAIGTTVVRAIEHAAAATGRVSAGDGVASQRLGAHTQLRVVDAILSGTHERGTSHYELLRAFASADVLERIDMELDAREFLTHEFGDSVLLERQATAQERSATGALSTSGFVRKAKGDQEKIPGHCAA